jgi:hypothetical protein
MAFYNPPRSGAAAIMVDPDTLHVTWCNEAVYELVPGAEPAGGNGTVRRLDQVVPLAHITGMADAALRAAETGETQRKTLHVPGRDGTGRTMRMTMDRLPDGSVLMLAVVL